MAVIFVDYLWRINVNKLVTRSIFFIISLYRFTRIISCNVTVSSPDSYITVATKKVEVNHQPSTPATFGNFSYPPPYWVMSFVNDPLQ